jgi:hypothetical protein
MSYISELNSYSKVRSLKKIHFFPATMNLEELSIACPGVDLTAPYKPYDYSFTIGDYIVWYLRKTFDIINSSPVMEKSIIVDFVRAAIKDHHLPFTKEFLIENLKCSSAEAGDILFAQSSRFSVSFEQQEYKNLGPLDFVPFVVDAHTKLRAGGYGMVEKVFHGDQAFARKTINDNFDQEKIMMEIKILRLATDTGNPHLMHLRCAYQQDDRDNPLSSPISD